MVVMVRVRERERVVGRSMYYLILKALGAW